MSVSIFRVIVTYSDRSLKQFMVDGETPVQEFVRIAENEHDGDVHFKKMEILEVVLRPEGVVLLP